MNTPKQTFPSGNDSVLHPSPAYDKIKPKQSRVECPICGRLLAKAEPTTVVSDLLIRCGRCGTLVRLEWNIAPEP